MNSDFTSSGPSKQDTDEIFKRLRSLPCNKVCFDCAAKYPTWSSVTYGVLICLNCSAVHRSLGVHLSFVRSTLLDTNWSWLQIRQMQLGGNGNAETFFHNHNCTSRDAKQKYSSRGAQMYRQQLSQAATDSLKRLGTKIHIDEAPNLVQEEKAEEDFFSEHTSFETNDNVGSLNVPKSDGGNNTSKTPEVIQVNSGERKSIIGHRKVQTKQHGLGGKSKGLGASKVKTNFADIEKQAELSDKLKIQEKKITEVVSKETEELEEASMRLAYEDLSLKQSREVQKIQSIDPIKAKQVERLGMGFISKNGVSHSATSDMKKIEQENPVEAEKPVLDHNDFFDEIGFISASSSSFYMYKSSNDGRGLSLLLNECQTSKWKDDVIPVNLVSENKSSFQLPKWEDEIKPVGSSGSKSSFQSSKWKEESKPITSPERKPTKSFSSNSISSTGEAQKKFGGAKAISSQQYFSDTRDSWDEKSNLSKFEGSSSISSAEYFGRNETSSSSSFTVPSGPDFEDVKESVKQGVTKVAGKLSSLANGVMSSLQEKYGY